MNEYSEPINGVIDRFLNTQERGEITGYWWARAQDVVQVSDPDMRRMTEEDMAIIHASQVLPDGFESLLSIISGGNHTLLAKVHATFACVDHGYIYGWPQSSFQILYDSVNTEPGEGGVLLSGALYSRVAFHVAGDSVSNVSELDDALGDGIVSGHDQNESKRQAERYVAIRASAGYFGEAHEANQLSMKLAKRRVVEGTGGESEYDELDGGYPYRIMLLAPGHLASLEKLVEAVEYGMPDTQRGILESRLPQMLIGVKVRVSGVSRRPNQLERVRDFYHIKLRPLRVPEIPADRIFSRDDQLTRENVLANCSFDSLSYWVAVRVSRELDGEFTSLIGREGWSRERMESYKNKKIEAALKRYVKSLSQSIRSQSGDKTSVLELALKQSQVIDEATHWHANDLARHIFWSARALAVKSSLGSLGIRGEEDIADLYRTHALQTDLSMDDTFELARELFMERRATAWRGVPEEYRDWLEQMLVQPDLVDSTGRENIVQWADLNLPEHILLRFETIRDKHEPEGLIEEKQ